MCHIWIFTFRYAKIFMRNSHLQKAHHAARNQWKRAHWDLKQPGNTNRVFTEKNIVGGIQSACRLFDLFSQPPSEFIFKDVLEYAKYAIVYSLRTVCAGFILNCCLDQSENIVDKMRHVSLTQINKKKCPLNAGEWRILSIGVSH